MRNLVLIAVLVIAGGMLAVKVAAAEEATRPVHLHPHAGELTTADSVSGTANVATKFLSVEQACLEFEFSDDDLFGSGDELSITVDGSEAGGFLNPDTEPQTARTFCWLQSFHPEIISHFLDGKAKLEFIGVSGSVTLRSVTLTISGAPR